MSDARAVDRGLASALRPLPRVFLQFGTLAYDTDVPEFIELSILAGGESLSPSVPAQFVFSDVAIDETPILI